jgi:hypothetical protein
MTSRFATPLEQITLVLDGLGYHLPEGLGKFWNNLAVRSPLSFVPYLKRIIPKPPSFV